MWDFIVWVVCEWECEDSRQNWRSKEFLWVAREKTSHELKPCAQHRTKMWRVMTASFHEYFTDKAFPQDIRKTFCFAILAYLLHYVFTHIIYNIITHILWGVLFQIENPRYNPWELEIVIPRILYKIHCGFP